MTGTGDGNLTGQTEGMWGQRMLAFILTVLFANGTLLLATKINAPEELASAVIWSTVLMGSVFVGVKGLTHFAEAWAQSKLGKVESRTVTESTVTQTPPKKK